MLERQKILAFYTYREKGASKPLALLAQINSSLQLAVQVVPDLMVSGCDM